MYHKAIGLFIAISITCLTQLKAQNITKSPYSVIGVGEAVYSGNASSFSMGRVNQAIRRPYEVNWLNPASYSGLLQTNIETGAFYSNGNIKSSNSSNPSSTAWLGYINLAMPISAKKGIGFSFGIAPFTSVGYNINANTSLPGDTATVPATNLFSGRGGLSKAYIGVGFRILKNLSAGVNFQYTFGSTNRNTKLIIPQEYNMFNLNEDRDNYISGFIPQLGLQYHKKIGDDLELVIGSTITPQTSLNATQSYILRTLPIGSSGFGSKDTIVNAQEVKGNAVMPLMLASGVSLTKENKWLLAADFETADWKNYQLFSGSDSLTNSFGINIGGFFIPDYTATRNILKRMEYRGGFQYGQTNLSFNGSAVNYWGVSGGFGIPLNKSKSKISVGFEYFSKGTTNNNLIKEDYFRVIIGISFSDKWFYRYRYD